MSDVDTELIVTEYDEFLGRVKKQAARTTHFVTWHGMLHREIKVDALLPWTVDSNWINASVYDPKLDGDGNVVKYQQGELNVDATLDILAKVVKYARSRGLEVKKNYESSDFTVTVTLDPDDYASKVHYCCKRDAVCTAKVVGKRTIAAKPAEPPRTEDVIEWECEKISLLDRG